MPKLSKTSKRKYRRKRVVKKYRRKATHPKKAVRTYKVGKAAEKAALSRKRARNSNILHDGIKRMRRTTVSNNIAKKGTLVIAPRRLGTQNNPFGKRLLFKTPTYTVTQQLAFGRQGTTTFATLVNDILEEILPGSWAGEAITGLQSTERFATCNTLQLMSPTNPWIGTNTEGRDLNLLSGYHSSVAAFYDYAMAVGCDIEYEVYNPYDEEAELYWCVETKRQKQPNEAYLFEKLPGTVTKGDGPVWNSNTNFFKQPDASAHPDVPTTGTRQMQMRDAWHMQKTGRVSIRSKTIAPKSRAKVKVKWDLPRWFSVDKMLKHDSDPNPSDAPRILQYAYRLNNAAGTTSGRTTIAPEVDDVTDQGGKNSVVIGPQAYFWVAPKIHESQLNITTQERERHDTEGQTTQAADQNAGLRRYTSTAKYHYTVAYLSRRDQRVDANTSGTSNTGDRAGEAESMIRLAGLDNET